MARVEPIARMVYTARDGAGRLYTIGINTDGTNAFAAVYDPKTLENLYSKTCFGYRVHCDELKHALQAVADGYTSTSTH
jgi:hypothetical protein